MGPDFWKEMPKLIADLEGDDSVRVILLRGDGSNFSYGLDLPAMSGHPAFAIGDKNMAAERTQFLDLALEMQKQSIALRGAESLSLPRFMVGASAGSISFPLAISGLHRLTRASACAR